MAQEPDAQRVSLDSLITPGEDQTRPDEQPQSKAYSAYPADREQSRPLVTAHPIEPDHRNLSSRRQRIRATARLWWLESLACVLVVCALLAIVGTLRPYQYQPLPQWPYKLSINTLIAVYLSILKIAMTFVLSSGLGQLKWIWFGQRRPLGDLQRFDDASRGILGSLKLLWALRMKYWLPSLGALIAVLAVAIDAFGQQVVQFYSCSIQITNQTALIPRINDVDGGIGTHARAGFNTLSIDMQNSINAAIFNSRISNVSFVCPTGNCTFPDTYRSTGWCRTCADVSDRLHVDSKNETYTLPSTNLTASPGLSSFVMASTSPGDDASLNVTIQAISALPGIGISDPGNPWSQRGYGAAECTVYACLRTYSATIEIGNITETIMSESWAWGNATAVPNTDQGTGYDSAVDVSCLNSDEIHTLQKLGYDFDSLSTLWLPVNLSVSRFDPTATAGGFDVRPQCIYQFFYGEGFSVNAFLAGLLNGSVANAPEVFGGPSLLLSIYREGNVSFDSVDAVFDRVTQSMTLFGRGAAQGFENATQGQVLHAETCVAVHWGWIAYPAALVLSTIVFLVGITARRPSSSSGARGDDAWPQQDYKSSILPLMFHGLDEPEGRKPDVGSLDEMDRMRAAAERMEIRLQKTDRGWRFVEL